MNEIRHQGSDVTEEAHRENDNPFEFIEAGARHAEADRLDDRYELIQD